MPELQAKPCVVLGGSFNPVHHGHLRIAEELADALQADNVALLPNGVPPHRERAAVSTEHRVAMLRLALADNPRLCLDLRETRRAGASYMVDTLAQLRSELGDKTPLILAMGSDAYASLPTWRDPQTIVKLAHVVVVARPGTAIPGLDLPLKEVADLHALLQSPGGLLGLLSVTQLDISSSTIRAGITQGGSLRYLLPQAIIEYIHTHQLYRETE